MRKREIVVSDVWKPFNRLKEKCANSDTVDDFVDLKKQIHKLEEVICENKKTLENSIVLNEENLVLTQMAWVSIHAYKVKQEQVKKLEALVDKIGVNER